MPTKKKPKPTEEGDAFLDTPLVEPEPIPEQVSAEDRLEAMLKDQKKSQEAYRETGPNLPS